MIILKYKISTLCSAQAVGVKLFHDMIFALEHLATPLVGQYFTKVELFAVLIHSRSMP